MRINGSRPYDMPTPAASDAGEGELDAEVEVALLKKSQNEAKSMGEAALALIDQASDLGVNRPLNWGPVGRTINYKA